MYFNKVGSVALITDCADAHADLELHCPRMSLDPSSCDASYEDKTALDQSANPLHSV